MVSAVETMVTAEPPASGEIDCTCRTKARSPSASRASARGTACTRARPSASTQSRDSSAGTSARVTGRADSASRSWSSCAGRKRVSAAFTASSVASGAVASRCRSSAMARTGWSAGSLGSAGSIWLSAVFAASRMSSGVTGGGGPRGVRVADSTAFASATLASFGAWSVGTRLSSVSAPPTSGSGRSRSASASAAATSAVRMSIE